MFSINIWRNAWQKKEGDVDRFYLKDKILIISGQILQFCLAATPRTRWAVDGPLS